MTAIEFCSQLVSHESSLLQYAYRLNLKRDDAKDLVQETFLKALMNRDKYVDNLKLKSWVFAIMKNTFVDNYRRSTSQNTFSDQTIDSFYINSVVSSGSENPDTILSTQEIVQCVDQLKEKLRIPFKMYVEGYKYSEISEELNMKVGTVKSRIFLSRKHLMNRLRE